MEPATLIGVLSFKIDVRALILVVRFIAVRFRLSSAGMFGAARYMLYCSQQSTNNGCAISSYRYCRKGKRNLKKPEQTHSLHSTAGGIAGNLFALGATVSAVGILVCFFSGVLSLWGALIIAMIFISLLTPCMLMYSWELWKNRTRRLAGDDTPPTTTLKFFVSGTNGLVAGSVIMMIAFSILYFAI